MEGWRPENPKEAVLSACSTLITIVENNELRIVQFSHFSVKEYLTSDRLRSSGNVCNYHIPLNAAHTILARAGLTVLLQLDENVDKERLATFPLAFYAAQYWVDHAKFEDVELESQDDVERLFNPRNPYLAAWDWIYDMDQGRVRGSVGTLAQRPTPPNATALYYASLCGFGGVANYIICTHGEDVNAKSGRQGSPLHAALYKGHIDVMRVLLDHGANVNATGKDNKTPLSLAYSGDHLETMQMLLEHGADVEVSHDYSGHISHAASRAGQVKVVHLLLRHNTDVNAEGFMNWTPLHFASKMGHAKVVQLLLDHGADINAQSKAHNTPLFIAVELSRLEVVRLLLEHGADVHIQGEKNRTPYQLAESKGLTEIAQLLLEHGAEKK